MCQVLLAGRGPVRSRPYQRSTYIAIWRIRVSDQLSVARGSCDDDISGPIWILAVDMRISVAILSSHEVYRKYDGGDWLGSAILLLKVGPTVLAKCCGFNVSVPAHGFD